MSRKERLYCSSQNYHIILRGNNKQLLFYDNEDRNFFIQRMKKYADELNISLFSFCLMSNHIHILLGNANSTLSKYVQKLATSYAMRFNRKYERSGHLFGGRFKSEPVNDDEYFKTVLRYILQNPQKACISDFKIYKWSSYSETIFNNRKTILNRDYLYDLFNSKTALYDFVNELDIKECMEYENKTFFSDSHCIKIINDSFGFFSPNDLMGLSKDEQYDKIRFLKSKGLSINQLSRITGISRKIIRKA